MINIGLYSSDLVLTSRLSDLRISTSAEHIDINFSADGYSLLQGRYYTLNGSVTLTEIGELIEQHISRNSEGTIAECSLRVAGGGESATASFRAMYCDRVVSVPDISTWLKENFLSVARFKRAKITDVIQLSWYATTSESVAVTVYTTFLDPDGNRSTYYISMPTGGQKYGSNNVFTTYITVQELVDSIKRGRGYDSLTLQSFTVRCGDRSLTYFVDPSITPAKRFCFLNCFNIVEDIHLVCETTDKVKSDRSLATMGRSVQFYDVHNSKEYETETAPLTEFECDLMEQMLLSSQVRLPLGDNAESETDFEAMFPILITDFTSEISDSNSELNSVKFTWQFADSVPRLELPNSPGIFNSVYNPVYS